MMKSTEANSRMEMVMPRAGEPEVLEARRGGLPAPGPGQVMVRVEAAGVSFAEVQMLRGRYFGQPKFPFVPGYDLVGKVESVGYGRRRGIARQAGRRADGDRGVGRPSDARHGGLGAGSRWAGRCRRRGGGHQRGHRLADAPSSSTGSVRADRARARGLGWRGDAPSAARAAGRR